MSGSLMPAQPGKIIVEVKNVYGVEKVYPRCETGQLFAALARTETLTPQALALISRLGYTMQVLTPSLPGRR